MEMCRHQTSINKCATCLNELNGQLEIQKKMVVDELVAKERWIATLSDATRIMEGELKAGADAMDEARERIHALRLRVKELEDQVEILTHEKSNQCAPSSPEPAEGGPQPPPEGQPPIGAEPEAAGGDGNF